MLTAVKQMFPELYPLILSAYNSPHSSSFHWRDSIQSAEGVQRGDPLGPLLFCLTVHSVVKELTSELCIFYMDDGILGGNLDTILQDLHTVERLT